MEKTNAIAIAAGPRRLALVPTTRRPLDRDAALARVRAARRQLLPRSERFTHLKRMYD